MLYAYQASTVPDNIYANYINLQILMITYKVGPLYPGLRFRGSQCNTDFVETIFLVLCSNFFTLIQYFHLLYGTKPI